MEKGATAKGQTSPLLSASCSMHAARVLPTPIPYVPIQQSCLSPFLSWNPTEKLSV
ncbi:Uncharacterised protein [Chlamydia trachomatis]|nr:Uncharacterised protein [Chlamydia trachomatis]